MTFYNSQCRCHFGFFKLISKVCTIHSHEKSNNNKQNQKKKTVKMTRENIAKNFLLTFSMNFVRLLIQLVWCSLQPIFFFKFFFIKTLEWLEWLLHSHQFKLFPKESQIRFKKKRITTSTNITNLPRVKSSGGLFWFWHE